MLFATERSLWKKPGPRSEFLGIYPTWESLAVQGLILAAILFALVWTFGIRRTRDA